MQPGEQINDRLPFRAADDPRRSAPQVGVQPRVDVAAALRLIEQAVRLVAPGGQVILLGTPRAPYDTNCTPMLAMAHRRGLDIKGALEWI